MKGLASLVASFFVCIIILAQPLPATISVLVKDTGNMAISATVSLLKAGDSVIIRSAAAVDGIRMFSGIKAGDYRVQVTAVGFRPYTSAPIVVDSQTLQLRVPVTLFRTDKSSLELVRVTASRPMIRQDIDKTVVDVSAMISSATSNTLEVLEKTPGVSVNANGEISLNGRAGITVLINGRPTYMSSQDLASYLKSIPGTLVDKIELMENPSARYDAAGNAVINIRLKRNSMFGLTGSMLAGYSQGRYGRNNQALNVNYHRNKVNLFANVGRNGEKNYTDDYYDRKFYSDQAVLTTQQELVNNQQNRFTGTNINIGMDYAVSAKTTIGFLINRNQNNRAGELFLNSMNFDQDHTPDSSTTGQTTDRDRRSNWSTNINLAHKFQKTGAELTADVNYLSYATNSQQHSQNAVSRFDNNFTRNSAFLYLLPSNINIYTAKADYAQPLKNSLFLETGFKSSVVENDNSARYYLVTGSVQEIDNGRSNHFKYSENINAAYVNVRKTWRRFGTQAGLRVENTRAQGDQLGNAVVKASSFRKDYTKVFPGIFVSYKLDTLNRNTLTLSLTRRITRPNYQLLNPFTYYRDNYTYTEGNPLLNPQYQYRYELKWQHKQFMRMGLSYNKFIQSIFQVTESANNRFVTRPDNIGGGYMVLLSTSFYLAPAAWWSLNSDVLLSRVALRGNGVNSHLNFDAGIIRINLLNQFRFNRGWSGEFGGYYASKDFNGQSKTSGMVRVNAGIQKKIWKDKASIRLSAEDIFHSWIYHNRSQNLQQAQYFQTSASDTRRLGVAFTYRFGKETFSRKRNHNDNASDEEKSRVNP